MLEKLRFCIKHSSAFGDGPEPWIFKTVMCVSQVFCSRKSCCAHVLSCQSPGTRTVSSGELSTANMRGWKGDLCCRAAQEMRFFSFLRSSGWLRCYSERLEEGLWMSSGWTWVSVKITVAAVFCAEHALPTMIKDSPSQTGPLRRCRLGNSWPWRVSFSPQPSWEPCCLAVLCGSSCGLALKYGSDGKKVYGDKLGSNLRTALFGLRFFLSPGVGGLLFVSIWTSDAAVRCVIGNRIPRQIE